MFIAELFITTKTWKQTKYPLTDEWIKEDVVHTQRNKKTEIMPFAATWMQLEVIILSEVRKRINTIS